MPVAVQCSHSSGSTWSWVDEVRSDVSVAAAVLTRHRRVQPLSSSARHADVGCWPAKGQLMGLSLRGAAIAHRLVLNTWK